MPDYKAFWVRAKYKQKLQYQFSKIPQDPTYNLNVNPNPNPNLS